MRELQLKKMAARIVRGANSCSIKVPSRVEFDDFEEQSHRRVSRDRNLLRIGTIKIDRRLLRCVSVSRHNNIQISIMRHPGVFGTS